MSNLNQAKNETTVKIDRATLDMAAEWLATHYPDLDGTEYDTKLEDAALAILGAERAEVARTNALLQKV